MQLKDIKQRTKAWEEMRRGRITGSRVGSILGDNPYQSADDVLRVMVREYFGADSEFVGNEATRWGTEHEPEARAAYEAETGHLVEEVGLIVHPDYDWIAASPDGLIGANGAVELKCPYRSQKTEIPAYYHHQMQLVLHCTGRAWIDYFVWWPEATHLERVERDDDWLSRHLKTLDQFRQRYDAAIAGDPNASPHLKPLVAQRRDPQWQSAAANYLTAKQMLDSAKQREAEARQALLDLADQASEGAGVRVTPYERAGSIDWLKFAKDRGLADDAENYRKEANQNWRITVS